MEQEKTEVKICVGTTCHLFGSSHLLELEEHLPENLKEKVKIIPVPCLGVCKDKDRKLGQPPYVMVGSHLVPNAGIESIVKAVERA